MDSSNIRSVRARSEFLVYRAEELPEFELDGTTKPFKGAVKVAMQTKRKSVMIGFIGVCVCVCVCGEEKEITREGFSNISSNAVSQKKKNDSRRNSVKGQSYRKGKGMQCNAVDEELEINVVEYESATKNQDQSQGTCLRRVSSEWVRERL
jgi:DNA gyrase/topoisomerase IV subunit B